MAINYKWSPTHLVLVDLQRLICSDFCPRTLSYNQNSYKGLIIDYATAIVWLSRNISSIGHCLTIQIKPLFGSSQCVLIADDTAGLKRRVGDLYPFLLFVNSDLLFLCRWKASILQTFVTCQTPSYTVRRCEHTQQML